MMKVLDIPTFSTNLIIFWERMFCFHCCYSNTVHLWVRCKWYVHFHSCKHWKNSLWLLFQKFRYKDYCFPKLNSYRGWCYLMSFCNGLERRCHRFVYNLTDSERKNWSYLLSRMNLFRMNLLNYYHTSRMNHNNFEHSLKKC